MRRTILIIDNDPTISSVFEFILTQNNYNCLKTTTVSDAATYLSDNPAIDVAFLDFRIHTESQPSGLETLLTINPGLPVFIMMSYPNDRELKHALNSDAYGILYKPFDMTEILTLVSETTQLIGST